MESLNTVWYPRIMIPNSDDTFHDPTWQTRWSHEDPARYRRWRDQPRFDPDSSMCSQFIKESSSSYWPWGYVIYRTVYTSESDTQWTVALDKFDRYIYRELDAEDPCPARLAREGYRNVVFSDKDLFDGASLEQIREHYNQWKESHGIEKGVVVGNYGSRFNVCLVLDEKALSSLFRHAASPGWCVMVDPNYYDGGSFNCVGYKGFMFVELGVFWWLYMSVDAMPLDELTPFADEDLVSLFDGINDKAVNEDGNVVMKERRRGGR